MVAEKASNLSEACGCRRGLVHRAANGVVGGGVVVLEVNALLLHAGTRWRAQKEEVAVENWPMYLLGAVLAGVVLVAAGLDCIGMTVLGGAIVV